MMWLVCREVFYVAEEMLCVPKLYVPIHTCMLRVVNNDTGEEVPRVFQKVAPFVYKKNKVWTTSLIFLRSETDMWWTLCSFLPSEPSCPGGCSWYQCFMYLDF